MTLRVSVLDMQPISPPVGGGRLRLLGLYHGLGGGCAAEYVGTYDWPGEPARTNRLSAGLLERTLPLDDAHFAAARSWSERAGGRVVIDVTFPQLAHLSPGYVAAARRSAAAADVVVFSHPWVFPLVEDLLAGKLVVYDAQNVESVLRARLLGDDPVGAALARQVALLEAALCREADLVLACSLEDRDAFHRIYGVPLAAVVVVPNGAFTSTIRPATTAERQRARAAVGVGEAPVCLFLGSLYPPNLEAATWIAQRLAPDLPEVTFAICGGVGEGLRHVTRANLVVTGQVAPALRDDYLAAADLAVNPMMSGSGTNVKMLELMAAGLPVVTTAVGARGIESRHEEPFLVAEIADLATAVRRVVADPQLAARLGRTARRHAEVRFSWETISERLGHLLHHAWRRRGRRRPFFSVVVPTRDRPEKLAGLLRCLQMQTCRDFEVVVADQSRDEPPLPDDLDVAVLRPRVPGAVRARNAASFCARGEVLAFVDDDCQPMPDWLAKARRRFDNPLTVGVEGRIMGHPGEPGTHWVCNDGVEGLGFLTANLFARRDAFLRVGGFDESFEDPHFREDSDLGWRLLELGELPFADDVLVYHPPHDAPIGGEWLERAFAHDALLYLKHPYAYRCLQAREVHVATDRYRRGLLHGAARHGVDVTLLLRAPARGRPLRDGRATLRLIAAPLLVLPAAGLTVRLAVTNDTGAAWPRAGEWAVRLAYRWFDDAGRLVTESGRRTALPYDLEPGETAPAVCQVIAPERPGVYRLLVTLVQEGVGWWDQTTATALFHRVGVVDEAAASS